MATLQQIFKNLGLGFPTPLIHWEDRVDEICTTYEQGCDLSEISEINIDTAFYLFDHIAERVVLAYAISTLQLTRRDTTRMRGFPNVNATVEKIMGDNAFKADKGHFLGHASGGILDINLFPQRRELNRGWSDEGKVFRRMESYVAEQPGTFFYHRPIYDDDTWLPQLLEYGVLKEGKEWWVECFANK